MQEVLLQWLLSCESSARMHTSSAPAFLPGRCSQKIIGDYICSDECSPRKRELLSRFQSCDGISSNRQRSWHHCRVGPPRHRFSCSRHPVLALGQKIGRAVCLDLLPWASSPYGQWSSRPHQILLGGFRGSEVQIQDRRLRWGHVDMPVRSYVRALDDDSRTGTIPCQSS